MNFEHVTEPTIGLVAGDAVPARANLSAETENASMTDAVSTLRHEAPYLRGCLDHRSGAGLPVGSRNVNVSGMSIGASARDDAEVHSVGQSIRRQPSDQLDLHRYVERQLCEPDGTAGMSPGLAENLDEQIGAPVDDRGSLVESGCHVDHSEHLDYSQYPIKVAQLGTQGGKDRQRGQSGGLVRLIESQVGADLPTYEPLSVDRSVTAHVHEVVLDHTSEIVACRWEYPWKHDAQLFEPLCYHARNLA